MLRYTLVMLLGLLSLCETAVAAGAQNCTTEYLVVDIDIVSDGAPCDSNGTHALQEMISHIVNKRFTKYGEEAPEIVSSIEIDGVCQSPLSSDRRSLQESGGFLYSGGGPCRLCWGDDGDTVPLDDNNRKRMLRRSKPLTLEEKNAKIRRDWKEIWGGS